jgi:hypothetical protein
MARAGDFSIYLDARTSDIVLPTLERAHIVLSKCADHSMQRVSLRQL